MNNILVSIRPKWCEKIFHEIGKDENSKPIYEKRIEVRKTAPKELPFKAFIYQTKSRDNTIYKQYKVDDMRSGKVIGEFVCDKVYEWECKNRLELVGELGLPNWRASYMIFTNDLEKTCLTYDDLWNYGQGKALYGWHISDLKIYDKPRELSDYYSLCKKRNCYLCDWEREYDSCGCNYKKPIERPPQSWCYVEEEK